MLLISDVASPNQLARKHQFDIPRQSVGIALDELATQAGVELLLYPYDMVQSVSSNPVIGIFTVEDALGILLQGSGLVGSLTEGRVITISSKNDTDNGGEKNKSTTFAQKIAAAFSSLFGGFGKAEVLGENLASSAHGTHGTHGEMLGYFEEIIVTANRREQSIHEIAMSIAALDGEDIERRSLVGVEDYLSTIPGVSQVEIGAGKNQIVIRGIGTVFGEESSVGVYFGEVPLTGIADHAFVDIKLVDMERIELLRGPQGTLYGSGSMSGTVRNIPVAPDLQEFEGKLDVGYSNTADTGGDNSKAVGVVNIPVIEDQLAVRVAAYRFDNSGYIEDVSASDPIKAGAAAFLGAAVLDRDDVGNREYEGVRASVRWTPTDELEATLIYATQDLFQDGFSEVNIAKGGYQNTPFNFADLTPNGEFLSDDVEFTNLVLEYHFDAASLLSSSTWLDGSNDWAVDVGKTFGLPILDAIDIDYGGFAQEIRLVTRMGGPFKATGGLYYENLERDVDHLSIWGGNPDVIPRIPDQPLGPEAIRTLGTSLEGFNIQQLAAFGELSYAITDQLEVTLGARWFDYDRRDTVDRTGALVGNQVIIEDNETDESDTIYKVNASYTPSTDALVYAQFTQGFRLGKPVNPAPAAACDLDGDGELDGRPGVPIDPGRLDSDTLDNYELGGKFTLLDNRLALNVALYRSEWNGIPVFVSGDCRLGVFINAGEAVSQGFEFESSYLLAEGLRVSFGTSYTDAELSKDQEGLGSKGDRLPLSARTGANVGLQYEFEMAGHKSFLRADYAYIGGFHIDLAEASAEVGNYGKLNMRAGIDLNNVNLALYANNLTNEDALIHALESDNQAFRLKPRTVGLDVNYQF